MMKHFFAAAMVAAALIFLFPAHALAAVPEGMTSKVDYDNNDPNRYQLEVDLSNQIITVYQGENVVLQSLCTTGNSENPTSAGKYPVGDLKERFGYFVAYGQYAQYWTQIVRGIYIHSIMYDDSADLSSISKTAYNNLGRNVSHGCVRVLPDVAQWIFYNCPPGTTVNVTRKPKVPELKKSLRASMKSYEYYQSFSDDAHCAPLEIPAIITGSCPLRTGFSGKDRTVGRLKRGDKVVLLQLSEKWCKVRLISGKQGYIKTAYVYCEPDAPVTTSGEHIVSEKTWLYASRDTKSEKLSQIYEYDILNVLEKTPGWLLVLSGGEIGYVNISDTSVMRTVSYPSL